MDDCPVWTLFVCVVCAAPSPPERPFDLGSFVPWCERCKSARIWGGNDWAEQVRKGELHRKTKTEGGQNGN